MWLFSFLVCKYRTMSKYVNRFGNLIFSVAEQEIVDYLMHNFNQTFTQAVDHVCKQKRDLAIQHRRMGNNNVADQLLREIGELK